LVVKILFPHDDGPEARRVERRGGGDEKEREVKME